MCKKYFANLNTIKHLLQGETVSLIGMDIDNIKKTAVYIKNVLGDYGCELNYKETAVGNIFHFSLAVESSISR